MAVTDPELIEVFDNFALDEVLQHGNLDARTRLMVQLASMIACQALREYRVMPGAALIAGVTPVEAQTGNRNRRVVFLHSENQLDNQDLWESPRF